MKVFRTRFGGLLVFGVLFVGLSFILRTALLVHSAGSVTWRVGPIAAMYLVGLGFDLIAYSCLALPVALVLLLTPERVFHWRPMRYIGAGVYSLAVFVMLFDVAAEWLFWDEFGHRFNFIAVDYLVYTQELVGNIWESYPVAPILLGIALVTAGIVVATWKLLRRSFDSTGTFRQRLKIVAVFLLAPVLPLLLVDQSMARVCGNEYVNELGKNGVYSLFAAFFENTIDYRSFYAGMDDRRAFQRLRELLKADNAAFVSDDPFDITRTVTYAGPAKSLNVIIVVVESLNAEYLGCFGDTRGLTPRLDELSGRSLVFRNLYATGTRTDRGLEAIVLSIPPTPGQSVLKRDHNDNLLCLGDIFRRRGYETRFLYGGRSRFDNMNAFFGGNGFEIVDGSSFARDETTFENAWGLCDEDLFNKVLKEAGESFRRGRRFLSIAMTTSNHRPYTYPQKIDTPSGTGRDGAVKYTDYAIGDFLAKARAQPWFDDTLFVVIADHCANSAGRAAVPVARYRIPMLIHAPQHVRPGDVAALCSQLDVGPTILGLLNWSYTSRFYGQDVLRSDPRRALLGNYQKLGLLTGGVLTLLEPKRGLRAYAVDADGGQKEVATDPALAEDAIVYYQTASYLLQHDLLKNR